MKILQIRKIHNMNHKIFTNEIYNYQTISEISLDLFKSSLNFDYFFWYSFWKPCTYNLNQSDEWNFSKIIKPLQRHKEHCFKRLNEFESLLICFREVYTTQSFIRVIQLGLVPLKTCFLPLIENIGIFHHQDIVIH